MNPAEIVEILQELRALPYFPNDEYVMNALVKLCGSMCRSLAEVQWLVNRMTSGIYSQWPGPAEMRACFCCRYKPKDGISAYSTVYPDGLPPDPTAPPRIEAPAFKALPPGREVTADAALDTAIVAGAQILQMPTVRGERLNRFGKLLKEILTPPQDRPMKPAPEPISPERRAEIQAEIDRILQEKKRA